MLDRRKHADRSLDWTRSGLQHNVRAFEDGDTLLRKFGHRGRRVLDEKRQDINLRPLFPELPM